jgi:hypothetical protein
MTPQELIDQNKTFSEELQQWIVPLIFVDQALQMKSAQEIEQNVKKLDESMQELTKLFNDLGNIKLND